MPIGKKEFRYDMTGNYYGTSKAPKPKTAIDGAKLLETDTGRRYRYDAKKREWIPE